MERDKRGMCREAGAASRGNDESYWKGIISTESLSYSKVLREWDYHTFNFMGCRVDFIHLALCKWLVDYRNGFLHALVRSFRLSDPSPIDRQSAD